MPRFEDGKFTRRIGRLRIHDVIFFPAVRCDECGQLGYCQGVNDDDVLCARCVHARITNERQRLLYETDLTAV